MVEYATGFQKKNKDVVAIGLKLVLNIAKTFSGLI